MSRARSLGFSLLELLVAMAIMAMSLGLLYSASTGALRGAGSQVEQQQATLLAQSLLDSRDSVAATGWQEQGQHAQFAWEISSEPLVPPTGLNAGTPLLHQVRISIRWPALGGGRRIELSTLLPQERLAVAAAP